MSGNSDDSTRVKEAWLAAESEQVQGDQRLQDNDLPVSSRAPEKPQKCSYKVIGPKCRQGRLKFEHVNTSRTENITLVATTQCSQCGVVEWESEGTDCWRIREVIGV